MYQYSEKDIPKYKKKAKSKGQPRADHKHAYIEVALHTPWQDVYHPSMPLKFLVSRAKVCKICGRVKDNDWFNLRTQKEGLTTKDILEKYPHWYLEDFIDKFAHQKEKI